MANITQGEKRSLEEFLQMGGGYVLDFSNRTFQEFVFESTGLNIDEESVGGSGSKANRLRHFWRNQPDHIVGKLLKDLVEHRHNGAPLKEKCQKIADRLLESAPLPPARRYYVARAQPGRLTLQGIYRKLQHLYLFFRDRDYFKETGITKLSLPEAIKHKAALSLSFEMFPVTKWPTHDVTEDHVFEALEFLYDHISRPGKLVDMTTETGFNYTDYGGYDERAGRAEFRKEVNAFLADYKSGFELTKDGIILALGADGLQHILDAKIVPYDEANVDSKVRNAIIKWRDRHLSLEEKKAAIRELADVFEWLKKTKGLSKILDRKDDSAIFELANNFALRHHNPDQKTNYDRVIWYSWMFHFYLATYHAAIRLLIKHEQESAKR
ncbi:MAG: hypothetical protein JWN74_2166 [Acidobacteriaceae bacterium]|nr:hypothetical protein [Acidobacteriaceae bacterium]